MTLSVTEKPCISLIVLKNKLSFNKDLTTTLIHIANLLLWVSFIFSHDILVDVKLVRFKIIYMQLSLIFLAAVFAWFVLTGRIKVRAGLPSLILLAFILYAFLLYLFSANRPLAHPQWQRIMFSFIAFFMARHFIFKDNLKLIIKLLLYLSAMTALYGILQHSGGISVISVPKLPRVYSTFGNPNFFASFLIGILPVSLWFLFKEKKTIYFLFTALFLAGLFFTYTRGAWLAVIIMAFFWIAFLVKGRKRLYFLISFVLISSVFLFFTKDQWGRTTERLLIWRDTLKMFASSPVTGIGLGEFHADFREFASKDLKKILPAGRYIVNYAHNEFLEILAEMGLVGLGLYMIFLFVAGRKIFENSTPADLSLAFLAGAYSVFIHSMFSVNMRFGVSSIWAFWLLGISLNLSYNDEPEIKSLPSNLLKDISALGLILLLSYYLCIYVYDPLISQKKLKKDVDFFDSPKEYDEEQIKKTIESDPKRAMEYYKLGWTQAKKRDFQSAVSSFRRAIELDPGLVGAYNNLGNIYYTIGRSDIAVSYYKQALLIDPSLSDAHFNLGFIYYHMGNLKEAAEHFNEVLKLEPDNHKAKIMLEKMVQ